MTISSRVDATRLAAATSHFKSVDGYLSRGSAQLFILLDEIQRVDFGLEGDILEVGAFKARSSIFFGHLLSEGETLHVSDLFDRQDLNVSASLGPGWDAWKKNFDKFSKTGIDVLIHRGPSQKFQVGDRGNTFRITYLDGGHSTQEVLYDLELAEKLLTEDGCAIVDDTFFEDFPGTTEGVIAYTYQHPDGLVPFLCFDNKVALAPKSSVQRYREAVVAGLDRHEHYFLPEQMFCGHPVLILRFLSRWELASGGLKGWSPWLHAFLRRTPGVAKAFHRMRRSLNRRA